MYRHTQTAPLGFVLLLLLVSLLVIGVLFALPVEPGVVLGRTIATIVLLVVLACAAVFTRLTVRVQSDHLVWWFGPGVLRNSVSLREIELVEPTRTSPLAGWGIHRTERGWLYNVSGLDAVWIRLRGGEQFLIGTDQPQELVRSIVAARSELPA